MPAERFSQYGATLASLSTISAVGWRQLCFTRDAFALHTRAATDLTCRSIVKRGVSVSPISVPDHLKLSVERYGETVILRLGGEFDIACEECFEAALRPL